MKHISPKKSLGQHFLHDKNIARKIVASVDEGAETPVVEIGPGEGALTGILLGTYPDFTAIEVDERAVTFLRERFPDLDVRHQNVLEVDWTALSREKQGKRLSIIGNLPYNITSQILIGLLDHAHCINQAVLMMQREVAERLIAPIGTKAYGILSVYLQGAADVKILFRVSKNVFFPKPDVESAVVSIHFKKKLERTVDEAVYRTVVRMAFNQRRKTLRNSLRKWLEGNSLTLAPEWAGLRAEQLSPIDFETMINDALGYKNSP